MAEAKTLDYYLANPDEMPANLADLEASLEVQEPETNEDEKAGAPSDTKTEEPKEESDVKPEEEAPKLLSKDGKNEIPYQVLVTERERRAQAEKQAEELRRQIADIEAKVAAVGAKQEQQAEPDVDTTDDIEQLAQDFPEIGKVVKSLQMQVLAANEKLQQVEELEQQRRVEEASKVRTTVQESIDSVPALSYWQNEDPDMFAKAIEFDNILKADSRNAQLSMKQRFEKVVTAMEAVYGPAELPDTYKPKTPQTDMNELTEKAKEVVKETGSFKPRTLSDIPGGTPPAANESEKLSAMSPSQLAAMMNGMDGDQISSLLAKLG